MNAVTSRALALLLCLVSGVGCIDWESLRGGGAADGGTSDGGTSDGGTGEDGGTLPDAGPPSRLATRLGWGYAQPSPLEGPINGLAYTEGRLFAVGEHSALGEWVNGSWNGSIDTTLGAMNAVFARNAADIWAVGSAGQVLHYGGTLWGAVPSSTTKNLYGVWAAAQDKAWAVGDTGTILFWNGSTWALESAPKMNNLRSVWGSSATDVWAVGEGGTILHRDATAWGIVNSGGVTANLLGVWAQSTTVAFAVGEMGTLDQWNGTQWTPYTIGGGAQALRAVNGVAGAAYLVGDNGTVARWNGSGWSGITSGVYVNFTAVAAVSATEAWATANNGDTFHLDGSMFTNPLKAEKLTDWSLNAIWARTADDVWAVGHAGTFLRWNGKKWIAFDAGTTFLQRSISGTAANEIWALGDDAMRFDGTSWVVTVGGTGGGNAIFAAPGGDVWVVGEAGKILRRVPGSGTWAPVASNTTESLTCIHGSAADDIWVGGTKGTLLHWNGIAFGPVPSKTTRNLLSVWSHSKNEAWAAGERGPFDPDDNVIHWDGQAWAITPTNVAKGTTLRGIAGSGPKDVYAAGLYNTGNAALQKWEIVLHWDGITWSTVQSGNPAIRTANGWNGVAAVAGRAWVVGENGVILEHR